MKRKVVIPRSLQRVVSVVGVLLAFLRPPVCAQQPGFTLPPMPSDDLPTVRVRKAPSTGSLDDQLTGAAPPGNRTGEPPAAWEWTVRRFVNVGTPEPATLQETVRVAFVNRGRSFVRVTYRAKAPAGGFPAGSFRGLKEVSYGMERLYTRVVIRSRHYVAETDGPFGLVESDPPGHTLADFSTLGGIARGRNMVATVMDAFRGENTFAINGDTLSFVNAHFADDSAHPFPAEIVLGPVEESGRSRSLGQ